MKKKKKEIFFFAFMGLLALSLFMFLVIQNIDWIHWILLLGILFIIITYRFLIINNLNVQISKINNGKIGYLKPNPDDDFKITLFKGNLRDKTRDIFLKKIGKSYYNIKDYDSYKELKDDIKKIYNEQKLEKIIKRFSVLISLISIIGKFLYDYLNTEKVKNILLEHLLWKNIESELKLSKIINIICFLLTFFIISYFIYKIFELRFRDKRERINEVAECIEILYSDSIIRE